MSLMPISRRRSNRARRLAPAACFLALAISAHPALIHRYPFDADARDTMGGAHGTLEGGAAIVDGAVVLDGGGAYVDLPNGLVSTLTNATFEVWLTDNDSGNWSRILDFGFSTGGENVPVTGTNYLFISPQTGGGNLRAAIIVNRLGGEQIVDWPGNRLPAGSLRHLVWTLDAAAEAGRLFVDGAQVGENTAMTRAPAQLGFTVNNWLGRSQFGADAFLNASISEFRIYSAALSAAQVQSNFVAGPDAPLLAGPVRVHTQPQSRSALEMTAVDFTVGVEGTPPVGIQWRRNGVNIAGATNATLSVVAALTNHNAIYSAVLTNSFNHSLHTVTSGGALLSVTPDLIPPQLARADSLFPASVFVTFSEPLLASTATNPANYVITGAAGPLAVTRAEFGGSSSEIILSTAAQTLGVNYTLAVNGVRDISTAANLIAAGSQVSFTAAAFLGNDLGAPALSGGFLSVPGGFNITAGGTGLGGASDQGYFMHRAHTNDFDIAVRVASLGFAATRTVAGLMARPSLASNAPFAAVLASPGAAGCHFSARTGTGLAAVMQGVFPVNYPHTWLRLRREGGMFSGFASLDGQTWHFLGAANIALPAVTQVGPVLASGAAGSAVTAEFRDIADAAGVIVTNAPLPFEPPGPSSRRTALVITEIMYSPRADWPGGDDLEFVELWNSGFITEDLTGHRLEGEIAYQFPDGARLAPGEFLVIARNPGVAAGFYGVNALGPFAQRLNNTGGSLRLLNELGGRLLDITYGNSAPWPAAPDGAGHSLVLSRPSYGENDPRAWSASDTVGGSPGRHDPWSAEPARAVVINEFLAHTDGAQEDFIELFNTGDQPVNLSGCWLSDSAAIHRFQIPSGAVIPARGFLSFTQTQLGFALAAAGEAVFLVNSNRTRVLDAFAFGGQEEGVSFGRFPDGAPPLRRLDTVTIGAANTQPRIGPVVINEIMYHPVSGLDDDEYIELHNIGAGAVSLAGWRIEDGVNFTFPSNAVIAAGGYVVVARNATNLLAKHPHLNATNTFGNYGARLSNRGERVALAMPETVVSGGVTNTFHVVVNEVAYADGGRWPRWADGGGSSLELVDPRADNRFAASWAASDESAKAPWTFINVTNILENGQAVQANNAPNRFEIFHPAGAGEALVDNVEFYNNAGANLVLNGAFEAGTNGWVARGVTRGSHAAPGAGIGGSQALRVVSAARGDTGANKIFTALGQTATVAGTNTGNVRAAARWLRGSPYIMFRLRGNWMEVSHPLNVPGNCGTPGLPNSRLVANAGPVITDVAHSPVLPAAGQHVTVTARVHDPDGVGAVRLWYRTDPGLIRTAVNMTNHHGLHTAVIPAQAAGTLMAFVITADDAAFAAAQFPAEAPLRECLVRWGESVVAGPFGNYRLWVTASNIAFWTSRERNANDLMDATFVYGNHRAVYNVGTMYSGSPFHTPIYTGPLGANPPDFEVNFPPDDRLLGSEPFVLSAYLTGGGFFFTDGSGQVDLTATWIGRKLGQQYNYRRHVHMFVNGMRRGTIYDDVQQPNSEMLEQYFPYDEQGELRKIEDWFEFADDGQTHVNTDARLTRVNTSAGGVDTKRYRWNWRPRVTRDPNNWFNFTNLVVAANSFNQPGFTDRLKLWMDVPNFLRPIVTAHVAGSWDTYGFERGKNMYAYKPDNRPWRLQPWDIELALGAGGRGPNDSIYAIGDPTLRHIIINHPSIHREYLRAFQEAVDGPLAPGAADTALDERFAAFQMHNVGMASPQFIKNFIAARRAHLQSILPVAAFALTNAPHQIFASSNVLVLGGDAPLSVETILVNGVAYPVTWNSVTRWQARVPLEAGTNLLSVTALDRHGRAVSGATASMRADFTGAIVAPEGRVVFSEIMHAPAVPGAEYVELFNTHSNQTFDLSGWRVDGLGYTFPSGALLGPRSHLVIAADPVLFNLAYGPTNLAFGQFPGALDPRGETLALLRPGANPNEEIVVNRVRFEAVAPWPAVTNGASLQLIDPAQDNSRVANWAAVDTNAPVVAPPSPLELADYNQVWRYQQTTNLDGVNWTAPAFNDSAWPSGAGLLAFESNPAITPLVGTVLKDPRAGSAFVQPGHAYYFRTTVNLPHPPAGYQFTVRARVDDGAVFFVNGAEVQRVRMPAGVITNRSLATGLPPGNDATADDVFDIPASAFVFGANVIAARVHQSATNSTDIVFGMRLDAVHTIPVGVTVQATPGFTNSVAAELPPFPPLWLNELQAVNLTGPQDNFGQRDPWAELHHAGPTNFSLAGYFLSDSYTNLTRWAFPETLSVGSNGFLVVWCDDQTNQTAGSVAHAGFTLPPGAGQLALSRLVHGRPQLVDYLTYTNLAANWSYGAVPDGQPFHRRALFHATPGATNSGAAAPVEIRINEWLADNAGTLADPADGNFEDWFELYNPGTDAVNLGGYFLTDTLANPTRFQIPDNGHYIVPAGGFLLVWADNEPAQNSAANQNLHVNFALARGGEMIGLFAPDGSTAIDAVTFGPQTTDMSQGRFPDGGADIHFMPRPTPRAPNVIPNTPPVLGALANRLVTLGQTLSFTASATDADIPAQALTFSLSNAPAGAVIGPASGVFAWTPAAAPATNVVTVVVTDNGAPALSHAGSFTVVVAPRPEVWSAGARDGRFIFSWPTMAGQRFQVESTATLSPPVWMPAGEPMNGFGLPLSFTNVIDGSSQRYFRVRVLP